MCSFLLSHNHSQVSLVRRYSCELNRYFGLVLSIWEAMTTLGSILKSSDIPLLTKVCLVKTMAFPVVMYGCEIWTIKKVEH